MFDRAGILVIALPLLVGLPASYGEGKPVSAQVARELNDKALTLLGIGEYEQAAILQTRALEVWSRLPDVRLADLAAAHFNLAQTWLLQGKLTVAKRHARTAREIAEHFIAEQPEVMESRWRIAVLIAQIHFQSGEYLEADKELRYALPHLSDLQKATALNDLGMTRAALGDLASAREFLDNSLTIREQTGGAVGPDHARTLANLALICFRQGDLSAAAELYHRAIPIFENAQGTNRLHAGVALTEYAQVLRRSGRKPEAKSAERRAKAILGDPQRASTAPSDSRGFR